MHLSRLYMFRMSKAYIIRSSICTKQVGRYNVRVIVGSSYGVVRRVLVFLKTKPITGPVVAQRVSRDIALLFHHRGSRRE